jgi:hypothetical protein
MTELANAAELDTRYAPAGAAGPQGPAGPEGPAGPQGPAGADGNDGAVGPQGSQGIQGVQGPQGPAGADGDDGAQGSQGIQGAQGPQGEQGPAGPAGSYALVATLAGDQATGANTTPVTLTGLVWTFEANSTYFFRWIGKVSPAAATTGCGFQLDVSAAVTEICMAFEHQLANTGTLSGGHSIADDASVGVSSGMPGTSTYPVIGSGMLRTGANAGTAQLRFRSETTAVTTAKAGMTLVVEKVG